MKKIFAVLAAVVMCLAMVGCGEKQAPAAAPENAAPTLTIPDVIGTDEATAKNVLSSMGIIPAVEYGYSDDVDFGYVYKISPSVGSGVSTGTKATVYVSKGVVYAESVHAVGSLNGGSELPIENNDDWGFYAPTIENGVLKIKYFLMSSEPMSWADENNKGTGYGTACLNDTFDKTVPLVVKYSSQYVDAYETQSFILEIPISALDVDKPTDMYMRATFYDSYGDKSSMSFHMAIEW